LEGTYQLNERVLVHDDGTDIGFYSAAEGRGSVLRGLGAAVFRDLYPRLRRAPFMKAELAACPHLADDGTREEFLSLLLARKLVIPAGPSTREGPAPSRRKRLGLSGSRRLVELLQPRLEGLGLRDISLEERDFSTEDVRGLDLLVLVDDTLNIKKHRALNTLAMASGVNFLSVRLFGTTLELGPLVVPGASACFECYWHRLQAAATAGGPPPWLLELERTPVAVSESSLAEALYPVAAVHAALEIHRCLEGGTPPLSLARLIAHDVSTLGTRFHPLLEVPGCHACAMADAVHRSSR
jgi:bacteriocin biosynthesis cyclodehydratase domain-containing protein